MSSMPETDSGSERILICIATYNERDNLKPLIEGIHVAVPAADVLVVDDNSPDGTGRLADEMATADKRIHTLHRAGKLGLGTAVLAGVSYADAHNYGFLITMDADFSHHPRYLPHLLQGMPERDVMIGSRYVPGGGVANWPLSRRMTSKSVNLLVRLLFGIPARDTSGGFRCYRVAKLREANLGAMVSRGYSFQEEALYRCYRAGARIGETPIIFENRRVGASKVNPREIVRSLSILMWLGLGAFFHRIAGSLRRNRPISSADRVAA
jgi:dolichol-phosphate mannosyltransferase